MWSSPRYPGGNHERKQVIKPREKPVAKIEEAKGEGRGHLHSPGWLCDPSVFFNMKQGPLPDLPPSTRKRDWNEFRRLSSGQHWTPSPLPLTLPRIPPGGQDLYRASARAHLSPWPTHSDTPTTPTDTCACLCVDAADFRAKRAKAG